MRRIGVMEDSPDERPLNARRRHSTWNLGEVRSGGRRGPPVRERCRPPDAARTPADCIHEPIAAAVLTDHDRGDGDAVETPLCEYQSELGRHRLYAQLDELTLAYRAELHAQRERLTELRRRAIGLRHARVRRRDAEHSNAAVLADVLRRGLPTGRHRGDGR
jgi:hypothetical protein